ncbi:MAG: TonB-dependent receptor [Granulosicoccaceae bacterium]
MYAYQAAAWTHSRINNSRARASSGCSKYSAALLLHLYLLNPYYAFAQAVEPDVTELEEIVVEEDGEPEAALPLGIGISGETLSTAPGSGGDPLRTLQSLPGLTFTDDEEELPAVRGSRPGDNYFQADFAPSGYLFHLFGLSVFHPDLIKTFNIYQSAYGPEFSGVTGGVFDIELREPKTDRLRASVDVSIFQAGALIEGPISETQSVYLAGRVSYLDLLVGDQLQDEEPDEEGFSIIEFPKYSDYQGKYVWKPREDNKLTIQFNGASDTGVIRAEVGSEDVDTDPIFAGTTSFDQLFHQQALVWDHIANDKLSFKSLLSHSRSGDKGSIGSAGSFDLVDDSILLKSHANYALTSRHDLAAGARITRQDIDLDVSFSLPPCGEFEVECLFTGVEKQTEKLDDSFTSVSAFVKDNWYVTDRLTLYPGLTFHTENYLDRQFVEPRLAAEYSLSESTILSAGLGQYNQAPDYVVSSKVFGNPDIKYSNALHAQVGVQKSLGRGWSVKSELYYKSIDDLPTTDAELNYTNDGEGSAFGLDTLIRKKLSDKFSGWASISLSEARRKDTRTGESFVFDYDQPFNLSLVGSYKFNNKWSIGAKLWAHSGAPYTPIIDATEDPDIPGFYRPNYGKLNSKRFPLYHRVDLRIDRTFKRKKDNTMGAYFEVLNILGQKNGAEFDYNADYTEKELLTQSEGFVSIGFKASF